MAFNSFPNSIKVTLGTAWDGSQGNRLGAPGTGGIDSNGEDNGVIILSKANETATRIDYTESGSLTGNATTNRLKIWFNSSLEWGIRMVPLLTGGAFGTGNTYAAANYRTTANGVPGATYTFLDIWNGAPTYDATIYTAGGFPGLATSWVTPTQALFSTTAWKAAIFSTLEANEDNSSSSSQSGEDESSSSSSQSSDSSASSASSASSSSQSSDSSGSSASSDSSASSESSSNSSQSSASSESSSQSSASSDSSASSESSSQSSDSSESSSNSSQSSDSSASSESSSQSSASSESSSNSSQSSASSASSDSSLSSISSLSSLSSSSSEDNVTLDGFPSYSGLNGSYTAVSSTNPDGYPRYVKDDNPNLIIEYRNEFGPYSFAGGYYVIQIQQIPGSIPIDVPLYKNPSTNAKSGTWTDLQ